MGGLNPYAYAHGNPIANTDPTGEIVPALVGAYVAVDMALTAWDLYETYRIFTDECATTNEKWVSGGLLAAGVILPGRYGWVDDTPKRWGSAQYSVLAETKLGMDFYPGMSDRLHFQEANRLLHQRMLSDKTFADMLERIQPGIAAGVKPGSRGAYPRRAPSKELTWHHGVEEGVMQLVPRRHHIEPWLVQETLHPSGVGGMSTWGGGR
jgi:hypothetical protein